MATPAQRRTIPQVSGPKQMCCPVADRSQQVDARRTLRGRFLLSQLTLQQETPSVCRLHQTTRMVGDDPVSNWGGSSTMVRSLLAGRHAASGADPRPGGASRSGSGIRPPSRSRTPPASTAASAPPHQMASGEV
jgi:hypothetical protein